MEEYIKILESHINLLKEFEDEQELVQALENLIKGYREKEESEKYLYNAYQDVGKKIFDYAEELEKKDKIIDLMAEQLTTPIHSKEWVKNYYEREIEQ